MLFHQLRNSSNALFRLQAFYRTTRQRKLQSHHQKHLQGVPISFGVKTLVDCLDAILCIFNRFMIGIVALYRALAADKTEFFQYFAFFHHLYSNPRRVPLLVHILRYDHSKAERQRRECV